MILAYRQGRRAWEKGLDKSACPFPSMTTNWGWWVGGWNDRDIEDCQR